MLLGYATPAVVGMLVQALYNIIDRIFIGQGVGALAISGLTFTLPVMMLVFAFGMLLGIGGWFLKKDDIFSKLIPYALTYAETVGKAIEEAKRLNADAVICVRYATSSVMQSAAEVTVFGTAVKYKS